MKVNKFMGTRDEKVSLKLKASEMVPKGACFIVNTQYETQNFPFNVKT